MPFLQGNDGDGSFFRKILMNNSSISRVSSWTFVYDKFPRNQKATISTPGLMTTAQVEKLNTM